MAERFSFIIHEKTAYWSLNCPISLESHALTKDNKTGKVFAQCKFQNHSANSVTAVYVSIACRDTLGTQIDGITNYAYLDLSVHYGVLFGDQNAIPLPNEARSFAVRVDKVAFSDGTVWQNTSGSAMSRFEVLGKPIIDLGEAAPIYRRALLDERLLSSDKVGAHDHLPHMSNAFKVCGCGKLMLPEENICLNCGADFDTVFKLKDTETLESLAQKYAEDDRRAKEQEEAAKAAAAKKKKRNIILAAAAALVVVVVFAVYYSIGNGGKYNKAVQALERGDYATAVKALEALGDYKDSAEKLNDAKIAYGTQLIESSDYAQAAEVLRGADPDRNKIYENDKDLQTLALYFSTAQPALRAVIAEKYPDYLTMDVHGISNSLYYDESVPTDAPRFDSIVCLYDENSQKGCFLMYNEWESEPAIEIMEYDDVSYDLLMDTYGEFFYEFVLLRGLWFVMTDTALFPFDI